MKVKDFSIFYRFMQITMHVYTSLNSDNIYAYLEYSRLKVSALLNVDAMNCW